MEEQWNKVLIEIDEFMYGEKGLVTTAYADRDLNTYLWDMDKIEEILKKLKEIEKNQNGFSQEQKLKLEVFKDTFLEIDNGENKIKRIYRELLEKYKNLDI